MWFCLKNVSGRRLFININLLKRTSKESKNCHYSRLIGIHLARKACCRIGHGCLLWFHIVFFGLHDTAYSEVKKHTVFSFVCYYRFAEGHVNLSRCHSVYFSCVKNYYLHTWQTIHAQLWYSYNLRVLKKINAINIFNARYYPCGLWVIENMVALAFHLRILVRFLLLQVYCHLSPNIHNLYIYSELFIRL